MNPIHRTLRLIAAGTAAAAFAGIPSIAFAGPPLAGGVSGGGTLPIARTETVYTNHDPALAETLNLRQGIDIQADLDEAGRPVRWRVLTDGTLRFAFMQAAEIDYLKKPEVKFKDVTGDGVPELLVYRKAAKVEAGTGLSVYDGAKGFRLLFDVTDPAFTIADLAQRYELKETAGGGVRLTDPASGISGVIPGVPARGATVDPVTSYEIASGEIVAVQRVSGESGDGRTAIGWLRTTYTYRYGAFVPELATLADASGKPVAQKNLTESEGPTTPSDDI
ncbi:hypothetical protein OMP38_30935 [Cohnella ginsengisoli]|uniref:VCBS repeat-containing protein n=1 Tax=Cohnella ginsengisoli TaxID=425004 RepID=A0A9X4QRD4_9BACL|nr:hypothetical protein [Cohnella ginsengisoli]MDG0794750.1 hypothetical protein [Cohnella ginsengisoli]